MKETRKLSVIYFTISMILLLMVGFGYGNHTMVEYVHEVNGYDVYYTEGDNAGEVLGMVNKLLKHSDNFVLQSDFGIIEVENGEIVYNNIK